MILTEISAPSDDALPTEDLRNHLKLIGDDETCDDAVLNLYLRAAMSAIEARIGKALLTRKFAWEWSRPVEDFGQKMPIGPVQSIGSVTFTAGLGPDWGSVPPDLRQATILLAGHYYENRDDCVTPSGTMPFGALVLIEAYRANRPQRPTKEPAR